MPSTFAVPSTLPADSVVTIEVPSTLLPVPVVAHSHADPLVAHAVSKELFMDLDVPPVETLT